MIKSYDIIIVGGGMVGLSAALALAPHFSVAVIEANQPKPLSESYDARVSAINHHSIALLQSIAAWPAIQQHRVSAFEKMLIWSDQAELTFAAQDINEAQLGYIVENSVIRYYLWQQCQTAEHIELLSPVTLTRIEQHEDHICLIDEDELTYQAHLVIGADGHHSWLRQQTALEQYTRPYQQTAIVTTVATEQTHANTAWQHFLATGPLAFLPLKDPKQCSIVWSATTERADELIALDDKPFTEQLNRAFPKLGQVELLSRRYHFPLVLQHLKQYHDQRIVFIGDAAHRIHPMAGQGVNLGFMDVQCLAEVLNSLKQLNNYQQLNKHLGQYQRQRKFYNQQMIWLIDKLNQLFTTGAVTPSFIRNRGISLLNRLTMLKNWFIRQAL